MNKPPDKEPISSPMNPNQTISSNVQDAIIKELSGTGKTRTRSDAGTSIITEVSGTNNHVIGIDLHTEEHKYYSLSPKQMKWLEDMRGKTSPRSSTSNIDMISLPSQNIYFKGRAEELNKIASELTTKGRVTVIGPGGIGKSQLVKEYAHRYKAGYRIIFWIDASKDINSQYKRLARLLDIPFSQNADNDEIGLLVREKLKLSDEKWLIIYDNVSKNTLGLESQFVQLSGKSGHDIIITSRHPDWPNPIRLNKFSKAEAIAYILLVLRNRQIKVEGINEADFPDEAELAVLLNFYPLAISQALAYIKHFQGGISIPQYISLFKTCKRELWENDKKTHDLSEGIDPIYDSYPHTIRTTVFLSLENLRANALNKKYPDIIIYLLYFCSLIHSENIPHYLLVSWLKFNLPGIVSDVEINAIIAAVIEKMLIEGGQGVEGNYFIHNIIQEIIKLEIQDRLKNNQGIRKVFNRIFSGVHGIETKLDEFLKQWTIIYCGNNSTDSKNMERQANIKQHLEPYCLNLIELLNIKKNEEMGNIWQLLSWFYLLNEVDIKKSIHCSHLALSLYTDDNFFGRISCFMALGDAYRRKADSVSATNNFNQALTIIDGAYSGQSDKGTVKRVKLRQITVRCHYAEFCLDIGNISLANQLASQAYIKLIEENSWDDLYPDYIQHPEEAKIYYLTEIILPTIAILCFSKLALIKQMIKMEPVNKAKIDAHLKELEKICEKYNDTYKAVVSPSDSLNLSRYYYSQALLFRKLAVIDKSDHSFNDKALDYLDKAIHNYRARKCCTDGTLLLCIILKIKILSSAQRFHEIENEISKMKDAVEKMEKAVGFIDAPIKRKIDKLNKNIDRYTRSQMTGHSTPATK